MNCDDRVVGSQGVCAIGPLGDGQPKEQGVGKEAAKELIGAKKLNQVLLEKIASPTTNKCNT